jgi:hypothetical protein
MQSYWIFPSGASTWSEVGLDEYVRVERACGFHNTMGQPDRPATAAFTGGDGTRGQTWKPEGDALPRFDPEHHYYDQAGRPITLEQWAQAREHRENVDTELPAGRGLLRTAYLGFVEPSIYDARLYGSALIDRAEIQQIEVYDSRELAHARHAEHVSAIHDGFHCALCRDGQPHMD